MVDINLDIYKQGDRYELQILGCAQHLRCPINITSHDLNILSQELQRAIDEIAGDREAQDENKLRELAEIGHRTFLKVFSTDNARNLLNNLVNSSTNLHIEVASEDFFLPWELLYPITLDGQLSWDNFWGMNYLIYRVIKDAYVGPFFKPQIKFNDRPSLGILAYNGLPNVESELDYFRNLDADGRIAINLLDALNPNDWEQEFNKFRSFWDNQLDIAHFACHTTYDTNFPNLPEIVLSEEFHIPLTKMDAYEMKIRGKPLIIMNACHTGNSRALSTFNFAPAFIKYGARGVVATECSVPDDFAADFAQKFYDHLLQGESLGESLLATRHHFLNNCNNPSGLLYSMYADPDTCLMPGGDSNE